jgi:ribosome maturation factor RimP
VDREEREEGKILLPSSFFLLPSSFFLLPSSFFLLPSSFFLILPPCRPFIFHLPQIDMTHPLIPQIIDLATPVAETLGLEIVGAVFHTNQNPPVLRVDIRNPQQDTGLDDCERMSKALEERLDSADILPDAYVLEISSPGLSRMLISDREFISFKGFPVIVKTSTPEKGNKEWAGQLIRRDETAVYLNQKGRIITIPRPLITQVQLDEPK